MTRLLGCCLLLLGCGLGGFLAGETLRNRQRVLEELLEALAMLERDLLLRRPPLPELMEALSREAPPLTRELFLGSARALESLERQSFPESWETLCRELPALEEEDRRVLNTLGRSLGRWSAQEQAESIRQCRQTLREHAQRAEADCRTKLPLYHTLGWTAGALLAVLFF